jgi:hypothetical protein
LIFPFLVYPLGFLDVPLLRFLCPSTREDNDDPMALCEIDSVAEAVVDPHFANAVADRLDVTGVPKTEAIDPYRDFSHGLAVFQLVEPSRKLRRSSNAFR